MPKTPPNRVSIRLKEMLSLIGKVRLSVCRRLLRHVRGGLGVGAGVPNTSRAIKSRASARCSAQIVLDHNIDSAMTQLQCYI